MKINGNKTKVKRKNTEFNIFCRSLMRSNITASIVVLFSGTALANPADPGHVASSISAGTLESEMNSQNKVMLI